MLPLFSSQTSLVSGLVEHECPRCHREVELPLGALCRICRGEIEKRASKVALIGSGVSTALVAAYVVTRLPAGETMARNVGIGAIVVWFLLSNTTVKRIMRQWTR